MIQNWNVGLIYIYIYIHGSNGTSVAPQHRECRFWQHLLHAICYKSLTTVYKYYNYIPRGCGIMRIIRFVSMTTYLIGPQHISLDTKVGYLLATYTLRSSLRMTAQLLNALAMQCYLLINERRTYDNALPWATSTAAL